ncbi:MAG TPA: PQQ-dependent sugar dehydrogenase, partial [Tepidisphaeraceae bacterium]|nr:PQQ-dependent sugar dehydrogenase [Tepidisphaeraceae bacterium]
VSGRLSRLVANGNISTGTETVLIEDWANQFPSHSIGHLQFGPDGYLYASAGDGASFNFVDYGQVGNPFNDPVNEGGALRSLDVMTLDDPTGLDGTIIRINPGTGAAAPGNPLSTNDANANRIIAAGLRNPFRFNFRPGTHEIWVGDVGWNEYEESNRLVNASGPANYTNFGWPAYEGPAMQGGYRAAGLPLLNTFYNIPQWHTAPYYAYRHSEKVVSGSNEPTGGSSITGIAFYEQGNYPIAYNGAMFFADYSRKYLYVMYPGPNGLPQLSTRQVFRQLTNGAVELQIGPGGDLFYVDMNGGRVQRITATGANRAPTARITASDTTGPAPLTINFSGLTSTDPDPGDTLSYEWDLDGDGQYDHSTAAAPSYTYTSAATPLVR